MSKMCKPTDDDRSTDTTIGCSDDEGVRERTTPRVVRKQVCKNGAKLWRSPVFSGNARNRKFLPFHFDLNPSTFESFHCSTRSPLDNIVLLYGCSLTLFSFSFRKKKSNTQTALNSTTPVSPPFKIMTPSSSTSSGAILGTAILADPSVAATLSALRKSRWNHFKLGCNNDDVLDAILENQRSHEASLHHIQDTLDERYNLQPFHPVRSAMVPPPRTARWNVFKLCRNTDDILATVIQNQESHRASIGKTEKTLEHLYTLKLFEPVSSKNSVVANPSTKLTDSGLDKASAIKIFTRNHERSSHTKDGLVLKSSSDGSPEKARKEEASKQYLQQLQDGYSGDTDSFVPAAYKPRQKRPRRDPNKEVFRRLQTAATGINHKNPNAGGGTIFRIGDYDAVLSEEYREASSSTDDSSSTGAEQDYDDRQIVSPGTKSI